MELQLWSFFYFTLHSCYLITNADQSVFQSSPQAKAIFMRPKRANSFFVEEILKGNLERECYEERCNKEEAREVFEDDKKTEEFWTKYNVQDQCKSNPCQHGGICKEKRGGYICKCTDMYTGHNCENDVSECPSGGPLVCEHYCRPLHESYRCFCARGYKLHTDGRSCTPQAQDTCGYLRVLSEDSTKKNTNQNDRICPQGKCPWQVTFVDVGGDVICQGVILGKRSILTTATCMTTGKELSLVIGHSVEKINASQVTKRTLHDRYLTSRPDDDLAFLELKEPITLGLVAIHLCLPEKDFSENILMKSDKEGVVMGGENKPLYLSLDVCNSKLNLSFPLTNKMFCMEERKAEGSVQGRLKQEKKECDLPSGSPVATVEGNTAFLTGLFLSQSDCSQGLVFTKVSRYLPWIRRLLVSTEAVHT
ncbi:protein Z, vitamin K-dependent plasma glycoprotein b isoform X1 [Tachysurus vachellii]|uniref:protein Z, vitamin K-dependent plasma glycoprotein b isoform X1 n=1 Tax=Tachysurus vachellii TaxID=175792 RepID=UPI00296A979D|nr:protein Z, vitamin K-dependent plasma glycoprotein b isoform X1 [Tachysurus vachellii]